MPVDTQLNLAAITVAVLGLVLIAFNGPAARSWPTRPGGVTRAVPVGVGLAWLGVALFIVTVIR